MLTDQALNSFCSFPMDNGSSPTAEWLHQQGARLDAATNYGTQPIQEACQAACVRPPGAARCSDAVRLLRLSCPGLQGCAGSGVTRGRRHREAVTAQVPGLSGGVQDRGGFNCN